MTAPATEIPAPKANVVVAPPSTDRKPLTKKEVAHLEKELAKLNKNFSGIVAMKTY